MQILGIESSCDETAASVVALDDASKGARLLSNVVASSVDLHAAYGGVVPEIAARSHIESIIPVIRQALSDTGCSWDDIDGIAVTYGAGLGGSLLIGVLTARTLAIVKNKPLWAINHVEGHVYANFLTEISSSSKQAHSAEVASATKAGQAVSGKGLGGSSLAAHYLLPAAAPAFPMLALIVSGGHSQLVLFRDHFDYTLLGQTCDDAVGEAFDKVARILGLPYPGGPSVAKAAAGGNPFAFELPKAKLAGKYDFSFSGLKTAVLRLAQAQIGADFTFPSAKLAQRLSEPQKADIAASFQRIAVETLVDKTVQAFDEFNPASVVIAGGVAASAELRRQLAERLPLPIAYPDIKLCTDNGAMIAALGCFKATLNQPTADPYTLEIQPNLSM